MTSDRLVQLLESAVLAPSRHNSQPWLFEVEGTELRVLGDWSRALPAADPQGRELVMACGAALFNVEVAAGHQGMSTSVEVVAGGRKDGLLARLRLEEPRAPRAEDRRLFDAIPLRRTNRFGFDGRPVAAGVVTKLVRAAAQLGARVRPIDDALRGTVAEVARDGGYVQWSSARYRAELAAWSRTSGSGALDGMPGHAHGLSDPASMVRRVLVRLRGAMSGEELRDRQHVLHSPALLALYTEGDRPADWFRAGRALQCVLLHAAADGLSASFFSQAIEVPAARERLRDALGGSGWPQVLLRLGHGRALRPVGRRPVRDVLRSVLAEPPLHAIVRAGRHEGLRT